MSFLKATAFIAQFDVIHRIVGAANLLRFGTQRVRDGHKLTNRRAGVCAIDFIAIEASGYQTLNILRHYGVLAWAGDVLGVEDLPDGSEAPQLRLHCKGSQERWARHIVATATGNQLMASLTPHPNMLPHGQAIQAPPRAWADNPDRAWHDQRRFKERAQTQAQPVRPKAAKTAKARSAWDSIGLGL